MFNNSSYKFGLILILIWIIILGIYSNVLNGPPIFDDIGYIKSNAKIHDIQDVNAIWHAWKHPARFVGYLTFAINYHFHQYDYFGYHLTNIFIHIFNTTLVWLLVQQIFATPRMQGDPLRKNKNVIILITTLLFALHPMQTQAVSYMAQRFASLSTLFYLLSLYCFGQGRLITSRWRGGLFVFAGISAVLGMFTKQITMTLPITVVLYELCFFGKPGEKFRLNWKLVGIVLLFLLVIPAIFQFRVVKMLTIEHSSGSHRGDQLNGISYLLTQFRVICHYLRLMFVPIGQNLLYDFKTSYSLLEPWTFACFTILVTILAWGLSLFKRNILMAFGICWFFLALSVESSIITIKHVIFEHRMYLPSFGFFLFLAVALAGLFQSKKKCIVTVCVIAFTLSFLTYKRNVVWSDDILMWQDVIAKSPQKSRPYMNMGIAYLGRGDYKTAIGYFDQAIEKYHRNYAAFSNRGMAYFALGHPEKSIDDFNQALAIKDDYIEAHINRGNYYSFKKEYALAIADYNKAIALNPASVEAILNRGNKYFKMKNYTAALNDYDKTVRLRPSFAKGYQSRAEVYLRLQEFDLALDNYNQAISLDNSDALAFYGRGNIHFKKGNLHLALNDYNRALEINPNHKKARLHKGKLLSFLNKKNIQK